MQGGEEHTNSVTDKRILMILLPLGGTAVVINESNMMDVMFLIGAKSNDSKQLELDI